MKHFSPDAIQRRMTKKRGGSPPTQAGTPVGPRGGNKKLAPSNSKSAGSFYKKPSKPGPLFKGLYGNKNPR